MLIVNQVVAFFISDKNNYLSAPNCRTSNPLHQVYHPRRRCTPDGASVWTLLVNIILVYHHPRADAFALALLVPVLLQEVAKLLSSRSVPRSPAVEDDLRWRMTRWRMTRELP